jgi:hypothetical protein
MSFFGGKRKWTSPPWKREKEGQYAPIPSQKTPTQTIAGEYMHLAVHMRRDDAQDAKAELVLKQPLESSATQRIKLLVTDVSSSPDGGLAVTGRPEGGDDAVRVVLYDTHATDAHGGQWRYKFKTTFEFEHGRMTENVVRVPEEKV